MPSYHQACLFCFIFIFKNQLEKASKLATPQLFPDFQHVIITTKRKHLQEWVSDLTLFNDSRGTWRGEAKLTYLNMQQGWGWWGRQRFSLVECCFTFWNLARADIPDQEKCNHPYQFSARSTAKHNPHLQCSCEQHFATYVLFPFSPSPTSFSKALGKFSVTAFKTFSLVQILLLVFFF